MLGTRMADHRFIIVDDHPLFRGALGQALSAAFANAEVLEAGSLDELTDRLAMAGEIDLILLDLSMPGVHGVSGLLYLRAQHPEVPVVIVSASDDAATIRQCLDCGASGFIPKSQPVERIREAIRRIIGGEVWSRGSPRSRPSRCACS
jgi:DNA-binding NarL/FixJ family response regulator